ncbi:alpha/beta hydrolase [Olivibacter sp. SDN3]|uniref:alpha/beta fold hydrolase n=1 Tax=Olivibacter sp. SDN3 TaxID=2764720 RepID=UPI0016512D90|nr:alpha/beta hydrolase [Olivibacter sp. SDN3]QNL50043.1 alpha/beta hydrolase [Olivibacter sp. SDN3]
MNFIEKNSNQQKQDRLVLCYEDLGEGQPILFIHGWPSNHLMWEAQVSFFVEQGYRCIAYDRRGFGMSSRPLHGYNYDNFADDLREIILQLDLQEVLLVGFSMGGGEVARYFTRYGSDRISKAILLGAVTPYLLKSEDNPDGIKKEVFDEMVAGVEADRPAFLETFFNDFFGVNLVNRAVSKPMLEYQRSIALGASPNATSQCIRAFSETDFRKDLTNIDVPTLIVHGDADKIVPEDVSANISSELISNNQFILYPGAPHGFFLTHKERLNSDILNFIRDNLS